MAMPRDAFADRYLCYVQGGRAFSQSGNSRQDVFEFATRAVKLLHSRLPASITHFVMRVDIMQRGDGSMVLNEFESFEAYLPSRVSVMEVADAWLHRFWVNQMKAMIP